MGRVRNRGPDRLVVGKGVCSFWRCNVKIISRQRVGRIENIEIELNFVAEYDSTVAQKEDQKELPWSGSYMYQEELETKAHLPVLSCLVPGICSWSNSFRLISCTIEYLVPASAWFALPQPIKCLSNGGTRLDQAPMSKRKEGLRGQSDGMRREG